MTPEVTARHMGSGAVQVFATPEMVRLMEQAAVHALRRPPGARPADASAPWSTSATWPPTPVGATVTARAELMAVDGRRLTFRVSATTGSIPIGEGTHERALIDLERFEARAEAKRPSGQIATG